MNPAQLLALRIAGLITEATWRSAHAALSAGQAVAAPPIVRQQSLEVRELDIDEGGRTIKLLASIYDEYIPSHYMILEQGSLTPRPGRQNKLLIDHDHSQPVGYMLEVDDATLEATYYVPEGDEGDRALAQAANGLRDGASVGFTILEYSFDEEGVLHVLDAEWYETSLCALPAIAGAGVIDVAAAVASTLTHNQEDTLVNREQLAAALAAGTITQAQHDAALAALDATAAAALAANSAAAQTPPAQPVVPAELAAGPDHQTPARVVEVREPAITLAQAVSRVASAARSGRAADIALALTDIIPADDSAEAFIMRPDWIGELFQARAVGRPWIDSFGVPAPLTSMKREGYKITGRPKPSKYAGNKQPVEGLGKMTFDKAEFDNFRWAGGADFDRAFVDFGDEAFLTAYWNACVEEYLLDSDTDIGDKVMDAALANNATAPDVLTGLVRLAARGRRIKGASINRFVLSEDLFDEYSLLKQTEVPFWLANATTAPLDLTTGDADLAQLRVRTDPDLPDGTIVGYDTRAAKVLEKSPIQVRAVDIAKGGIDLGFYSYGAFDLYDPRLFLSTTVEPTSGSEPDATNVEAPATVTNEQTPATTGA